jgi:hypothetical protein
VKLIEHYKLALAACPLISILQTVDFMGQAAQDSVALFVKNCSVEAGADASCRRYVHLYQQKLDSLQAVATGISSTTSSSSIPQAVPLRQASSSSSSIMDTDSTLSRTASSDVASLCAVSSSAAGTGPAGPAGPAGAAGAGKAEAAAATLVATELLELEQELDVDEILLCRALAEVAVERRNPMGEP